MIRNAAPTCPHGEKVYDDDLDGLWLCPVGVCLPELVSAGFPAPALPELRQAVGPVVRGSATRGAPASRVEWLEALARRGKCRTHDPKDYRVLPEYLFYAMVFTEAHFDYSTGEGTRHQAPSYLAPRLGVALSTAKRFRDDLKRMGFLEEMEGRGRALGPGGLTPLYRLTVPPVARP